MGDANGANATTPKTPENRTPPQSRKTTRRRGGPIDPMAKVLATGPRLPISVTIAVAIFLHVGVAAAATAAALFDEIFAWQRGIRDVVAYRLSKYEIEITREPPPEEKPEPVVEDKPEDTPEEKVLPKEAPAPDAPPPQPAQAANVLTADPDPTGPVADLTNTFVTGSSSTYAGGTTAKDGTSKTPVYNPAAAVTGVPGGTGTAPAPPVVRKNDKSRVPGLLGSVDWNDCDFPGEANAEQIDQAFVLIQVKVKPDGSPENVSVMQDPGHGFGREARKCAMRKRYSQGLDPDGNAVGGTTKPFRVRFER